MTTFKIQRIDDKSATDEMDTSGSQNCDRGGHNALRVPSKTRRRLFGFITTIVAVLGTEFLTATPALATTEVPCNTYSSAVTLSTPMTGSGALCYDQSSGGTASVVASVNAIYPGTLAGYVIFGPASEKLTWYANEPVITFDSPIDVYQVQVGPDGGVVRAQPVSGVSAR